MDASTPKRSRHTEDLGSVRDKSERIERLKAADRWKEGDSPFGLDKVRVYRMTIKKKKKKKEEESEEVEDAAETTD